MMRHGRGVSPLKVARAPPFVVAGELFNGNDRLDFVRAPLAQ
jgi:2-hydroxychromene-2-carboxylate isomerase